MLLAMGPNRLRKEGDDAYTSDQQELGSLAKIVDDHADGPRYILVQKGVFNRKTYVPLDAVGELSDGKASVNIPKLVGGEIAWDEPPTAETRRVKIGPAPDTVQPAVRIRFAHQLTAHAGRPTAPLEQLEVPGPRESR